jgi:hypothetical protein
MDSQLRYPPEAQSIMKDFPQYDVWVSLIGKQWHARLKGATPPVMVHDDSPAGIREQIKNMERQS